MVVVVIRNAVCCLWTSIVVELLGWQQILRITPSRSKYRTYVSSLKRQSSSWQPCVRTYTCTTTLHLHVRYYYGLEWVVVASFSLATTQHSLAHSLTHSHSWSVSSPELAASQMTRWWRERTSKQTTRKTNKPILNSFELIIYRIIVLDSQVVKNTMEDIVSIR